MRKNTVRPLCLLLTAIMLFCVQAPVFASEGALRGDADGDGSVTVSDARQALRTAIGLEKTAEITVMDVDADNAVTVADARIILRIAIGLEKNEPVSKEPVEITPAPKKENALTPTEINRIAESFTVEISTEGPGFSGTGTGFFISEDGLIATNYHVIANSTKLTVTDPAGNKYPCEKVVAYDDENDFAVIKIDVSGHPFAKIGNDYATGDKIYTLGSSYGLSFTFSDGMISNAKREIEDYNEGFYYIQITAPISSGNSGGPLLDECGNVIGINTMSLEGGQNLNFAIPATNLATLDTSAAVSAEKYYKANETGIYASALKLKEACVKYGSKGSVSGIGYYSISSGLTKVYSLTYYYDYDILEVSYSTVSGSVFTGTTTSTDALYIDNKPLFECISVVVKTPRGGSDIKLIEAEYKIDGNTFKSGSAVSFDKCKKDDTAGDVSAYEKNSASAVAGMAGFLNTVISTYRLGITVADLGFRNF